LGGEGTVVEAGRRQVGCWVAAVQGLGVVVLKVRVGLLLSAWLKEGSGRLSGLGHVEEHVLLLLLLLLLVEVFWRGGLWWLWCVMVVAVVDGLWLHLESQVEGCVLGCGRGGGVLRLIVAAGSEIGGTVGIPEDIIV
jgi:hypothetical protein